MKSASVLKEIIVSMNLILCFKPLTPLSPTKIIQWILKTKTSKWKNLKHEQNPFFVNNIQHIGTHLRLDPMTASTLVINGHFLKDLTVTRVIDIGGCGRHWRSPINTKNWNYNYNKKAQFKHNKNKQQHSPSP